VELDFNAMGIKNNRVASPTPPGAGDLTITPQDLYRAAWASSLGSGLEYYDFALYSLASALVFGPLFSPSKRPALA
jgi:MHS family metabolite:H+ symporter-like MFS transporter